jgi:hypothetical protein
MNTFIPIIIACLSIGCTNPAPFDLTPFQCRVNGVNVPDGTEITGSVHKEISLTDLSDIRRQCRKPFGPIIYGCVLSWTPGVYVIVYQYTSQVPWGALTYKNPRSHEQCHAYYEVFTHIGGA